MADAAYNRGDYERVIDAAERMLKIAESRLHDCRRISYCQDRLAKAYDKLGNYEYADSLFKESLRITAECGSVTELDFAIGLHNYGQFCMEQERYVEAESLLQLSIERFERVPDEDPVFYAFALYRLGSTREALHKEYSALPAYEHSASILETHLPGSAHLALVLERLGVFYRDAELYDDAEQALRKSLKYMQATYDSTYPGVVELTAALARFLGFVARYDEAESLWNRAIRLAAQVNGDTVYPVTDYQIELGYSFMSQGRLAEADSLIDRNLPFCCAELGEFAPPAVLGLMRLGKLRALQGRQVEAESLLTLAVERGTEKLGADCWIDLLARNALGTFYLKNGRFAEALPIFEALITSSESVYGDSHPRVARALYKCTTALRGLGRGAEAIPLEQRAGQIRLDPRTTSIG
ncbi:MAG: tetratricopeptide repeat protein [bacterium]